MSRSGPPTCACGLPNICRPAPNPASSSQAREGAVKADLTRDTYDPRKRYNQVLMQQGRVQLDADWNEQGSILLGYLRGLAADLFGPHGGMGPGAGFELRAL